MILDLMIFMITSMIGAMLGAALGVVVNYPLTQRSIIAAAFWAEIL